MAVSQAADIGEVVTRAGDTAQQMLDRCSAAIVRHLAPDLVRIWMIGEDRARLEAKAAALGVADRVVFAGMVPEAEKVATYRLADVYAMPSTGEGFGFVPEVWRPTL